MSIRIMSMVWDTKLKLSSSQKLVLLKLSDSANDDGVCWPRQSTMAVQCGLNRSTVNRALKDLEDREIIKKQTRFKENGQQCSSVYEIQQGVLQDAQGVLQEVTGGVAESHRGVLQKVTPKNHNIEPSIETNIEPEKVSDSVSVEKIKKSNEIGQVKEDIEKPKLSKARKSKRIALESHDNFKKYMKFEETRSKDIEDWVSKDFVILFYCGLSVKYPEGRELPTWGKDGATMQKLVDKYGPQRLKDMIVYYFEKKKKIELNVDRKLDYSLSTFCTEWIRNKIRDMVIEEEKSVYRVEKNKEIKRVQDAEAAKRVEQIRNKLKNRVRGSK